MGRRSVAAMLVLAIASASCQLLVGLESRSERAASGDDASTSPANTGGNDASPFDAGCGLGRVPCGTTCVDLQTTSTSCGSCGHDCLGAACTLGECEPEQLADTAYGSVAAVDDSEVFYRPGEDEILVSALHARNKKTGAERTLGNIGRWQTSVVDGPDLVILENGPWPRLRLVNRSTGASRTLHEDPNADFFLELSVAGSDIYWTTRGDLRHIRRDGTGYEVIRSVAEGAQAIATSPTEVFYSLIDRPDIYSIPRLDLKTAPTLRASGNATVRSITRVGAIVYFAAGKTMNVLHEDGFVESKVLGLRKAHSTASLGPYIYVYDVDFNDKTKSRILRFDTRTMENVVLLSGIKDGRLAVDDTHVYFSNYTGGLYRVAR